MTSHEEKTRRWHAGMRRELHRGQLDKVARRTRNAAYNAQVALGQLQAFSLAELEDVVNSQPGIQQGVAVQLKLLRDKMTELMQKWEQVPTEARTVDAEPLLEVLPPEEKDKSLSVN